MVPLFSLCDDMRALMWSLSQNCATLLHAAKVHIFVVDTNRGPVFASFFPFPLLAKLLRSGWAGGLFPVVYISFPVSTHWFLFYTLILLLRGCRNAELVCEKYEKKDLLYTYRSGNQEQTYALRDSENIACHVAVTGQTVNLVNCKSQKRYATWFFWPTSRL